MLAASPKGTVPVVVLPDGRVIDESLDVMRWALASNDPEGWLARDDTALIALNDGPFKHDLDRYKYPERYGVDPIIHRTSGARFLLQLEERLTHENQLCGPERGLTDAAIFPFVRQFASVDREWFDAQPLSHLQTWLSHHVTSPLFETIMVRTKPWSAEDEPVIFPPPQV